MTILYNTRKLKKYLTRRSIKLQRFSLLYHVELKFREKHKREYPNLFLLFHANSNI